MDAESNLETLAALLLDRGICPEYDRIIGDLNHEQLEQLWRLFEFKRHACQEDVGSFERLAIPTCP